MQKIKSHFQYSLFERLNFYFIVPWRICKNIALHTWMSCPYVADLSDRLSSMEKNYWFDNFKSRVHIPGSLAAWTYLMRAYVVMYLPVVLAERVQSVISFGTIKGPTTLIPAGIHGPRALEYDSGIKRRLYDYSSYDSLTGSHCGRQLREERGNDAKKKTREREKEKRRKGEEMRRRMRIRRRTTKCSSYAGSATWSLAECTHIFSFVTRIRSMYRMVHSSFFAIYRF